MKYRIDEAMALAVRRHVRLQLAPDEFGASREVPSYPVHSLYLDSDDLALYQSTLNGDRNRFKLRVRYYNADPAAPALFEIKRRVDRCIQKQRALVRREAVADLLSGAAPAARFLTNPSTDQMAALRNFCALARSVRAKPRAHVAYEREAWVNREQEAVRVTFDRNVQCEPMLLPRLDIEFRHPAPLFPGTVILEIKFTDRLPGWLGDMVRLFGLQQYSAAKYVDGVITCGETHFLAGVPDSPWKDVAKPKADTPLARARRRRANQLQSGPTIIYPADRTVRM